MTDVVQAASKCPHLQAKVHNQDELFLELAHDCPVLHGAKTVQEVVEKVHPSGTPLPPGDSLVQQAQHCPKLGDSDQSPHTLEELLVELSHKCPVLHDVHNVQELKEEIHKHKDGPGGAHKCPHLKDATTGEEIIMKLAHDCPAFKDTKDLHEFLVKLHPKAVDIKDGKLLELTQPCPVAKDAHNTEEVLLALAHRCPELKNAKTIQEVVDTLHRLPAVKTIV